MKDFILTVEKRRDRDPTGDLRLNIEIGTDVLLYEEQPSFDRARFQRLLAAVYSILEEHPNFTRAVLLRIHNAKHA